MITSSVIILFYMHVRNQIATSTELEVHSRTRIYMYKLARVLYKLRNFVSKLVPIIKTFPINDF